MFQWGIAWRWKRRWILSCGAARATACLKQRAMRIAWRAEKTWILRVGRSDCFEILVETKRQKRQHGRTETAWQNRDGTPCRLYVVAYSISAKSIERAARPTSGRAGERRDSAFSHSPRMTKPSFASVNVSGVR